MFGLKIVALKFGLGGNTFLMKLAATRSVLTQHSFEKKISFLSRKFVLNFFREGFLRTIVIFASGLKRYLFPDIEKKDRLSQFIWSSASRMKTYKKKNEILLPLSLVEPSFLICSKVSFEHKVRFILINVFFPKQSLLIYVGIWTNSFKFILKLESWTVRAFLSAFLVSVLQLFGTKQGSGVYWNDLHIELPFIWKMCTHVFQELNITLVKGNLVPDTALQLPCHFFLDFWPSIKLKVTTYFWKSWQTKKFWDLISRFFLYTWSTPHFSVVRFPYLYNHSLQVTRNKLWQLVATMLIRFSVTFSYRQNLKN